VGVCSLAFRFGEWSPNASSRDQEPRMEYDYPKALLFENISRPSRPAFLLSIRCHHIIMIISYLLGTAHRYLSKGWPYSFRRGHAKRCTRLLLFVLTNERRKGLDHCALRLPCYWAQLSCHFSSSPTIFRQTTSVWRLRESGG